MELVDSARCGIILMLVIDGVVLLIAPPREQIGGAEAVAILETNNADVQRWVKRD